MFHRTRLCGRRWPRPCNATTSVASLCIPGFASRARDLAEATRLARILWRHAASRRCVPGIWTPRYLDPRVSEPHVSDPRVSGVPWTLQGGRSFSLLPSFPLTGLHVAVGLARDMGLRAHQTLCTVCSVRPRMVLGTLLCVCSMACMSMHPAVIRTSYEVHPYIGTYEVSRYITYFVGAYLPTGHRQR